MFGDWNAGSFENIIHNCSIPKILLLLQIVDQEGFVFLHVLPGFQVWKPLRVKANHRIDNRPLLVALIKALPHFYDFYLWAGDSF